MENLMVKEHSIMGKENGKETNMLVNLKMGKGMVKEHIFSMMGKSLLETSRMVKGMDRGFSLLLMEQGMLVNTKKVKGIDRVNSLLLMVSCMKENGEIINMRE